MPLSTAAVTALRALIQGRNLTGEPWEIATALNVPEPTGVVELVAVPTQDLFNLLLRRGKWEAIVDAADDKAADSHSDCFRVREFILHGAPTFHLDDPDVQSAMGGVAGPGGVLNAPDIAAIQALGVRPVLRSPMEQTAELAGMTCEQWMVEQAQAGEGA